MKMTNMIEFFQNSDEIYKDTLKPVCDKYNVTYMELTIILFLGNNPTLDKASDIVEKRHIAKSHASSSIRTLMDKELLVGKCLDSDRRSIHLKLLDSAKPILKAGQKAQKEFIDICTSDLSVEELSIIQNALNKMDKNLQTKRKELRNGK